jgi:cytochrome c biogenesis protein CcmG, thiol:disulfide interchange protein DsbE
VSRRSWPVASLLAAVVLLAGCAGGGSGEQASAPSSSPAPDVSAVRTDLAPCPAQPDTPAAPSDLPAVRLSCFSGGALDLAKAPGEPTVLNLWASWCGPCRTELPIVQQLADTAGNRIRVLGLVSKDGVAQAASFADDAGVTFPSAFDADGEVMDDLALRGLPYTYFLAADGSVAYVQVGPVSSLADLQQLVADHLGVRL